MVATLIAWGYLVDRIGERIVLALGSALTAAAAFAASSVHSLVAVGALLLLGGMAAASSNSASGRLVVGWFPPERRGLVRGLIYPVPDPRFPFLGVHFTRTVHGELEAGPNAVLAFAREGYTLGRISASELGSMLAYGGFWQMAFRYWRTGLGEFYRSFSKRAFVRALQRLVPDIRAADVERGGAGVRAQAIDRSGALLDDFRLVETADALHVLNAPSPAATASLAIGEYISAKVPAA